MSVFFYVKLCVLIKVLLLSFMAVLPQNKLVKLNLPFQTFVIGGQKKLFLGDF